jgi:hypothetical protein
MQPIFDVPHEWASITDEAPIEFLEMWLMSYLPSVCKYLDYKASARLFSVSLIIVLKVAVTGMAPPPSKAQLEIMR